MVASGSHRSTYVYDLLVYVLHVISVHVLNGFIQYTSMQCARIHFLIKINSVDFVPGPLMNSIPNNNNYIRTFYFLFPLAAAVGLWIL